MEYIYEAKEELKRVDHLVYVSLKYTRTVDVIKSVIDRLINFYDFAILELLQHAKNKKKISDFPKTPVLRAEMLKKAYPDNNELDEHTAIYLLLRKINRAEYSRKNEFRKHVTMTANIDDGEVVEVTISTLMENYDKAKSFVQAVRNIVEGKKND